MGYLIESSPPWTQLGISDGKKLKRPTLTPALGSLMLNISNLKKADPTKEKSQNPEPNKWMKQSQMK